MKLFLVPKLKVGLRTKEQNTLNSLAILCSGVKIIQRHEQSGKVIGMLRKERKAITEF